VAEAGAKAALEALAVHHHEPYGHMSPEKRKLRNHLRARARQLGDKQNRKGELEITHLVWECAYEHWHRMLFARFLAENALLIEPEMGVAISLEECEELAKEEGKDLWTLASEFAQRMLPQIFRPDDPLLKITFAREHRLKLEQLLDGLKSGVFTASDSLGWVYQFWQSKEKEEVIESGNKIGANELPSVTQIFTEDYMVEFMLDNTIGAWWASKISDTGFDVLTEEEARKAAALPGCSWKYLRFVKQENGMWRPAAGSFDQWPIRASGLRCLDPCCGSGHFLIALFERLVPVRIQEEGLSESSAICAVIRDNLYALEVDPRCTKLAAFALALAAWRRNPESATEPLPTFRIACCGLEIGATIDQWIAIAPKNGFEMEQLYKLFSNAATLGSLIRPEKQATLELSRSNFGKLESDIIKGLKNFEKENDVEHRELGVQAKGLAHAYQLMTKRYHLIATNVPYLARGKQCTILREFIDIFYPLGKHDLGIAFLLRCLDFCEEGGTAVVVTPQNWLFLWSYKKLRNNLLNKEDWVFLSRLGTKAFQTPMWDFNVMLSAFSHRQIENSAFMGIDVALYGTPESKAKALISDEFVFVDQSDQLSNPDQRVVFEKIVSGDLLSDYAESYWGIGTGDIPRFCRRFWEILNRSERWRFLHVTSVSSDPYSGLEEVIDWKMGNLDDCPTSSDKELWRANRWTRGSEGWGKRGVAISQMAGLSASLYSGDVFQNGVAAIIPKKTDYFPAIWTFCSSPEYHDSVRIIDQKLCVTT
jgi:hypothetical protein